MIADRSDPGHGLPMPRLSLFDPGRDEQAVERPHVSRRARWSINGFAAVVEVWSAAEWGRLVVKPAGVQLLLDGSRVGLRIE